MNGPIATATAGATIAPAQASAEQIGRVSIVGGAQATIELNPRTPVGEQPTVGKFMGLIGGKGVIIGLITEIGEQAVPGSGLTP